METEVPSASFLSLLHKLLVQKDLFESVVEAHACNTSILGDCDLSRVHPGPDLMVMSQLNRDVSKNKQTKV